jgi:hypothetical protein
MKSRAALMNAKRLSVFFLAVCILSLAGCGSTKVYTTQKSVTYKGDLYNVSNIQKIGTRVEGLTPDGSVINMKGMDKKAAQAQLDEHSPLVVSTVFEMDSQEMIYQRKSITKSSEFSTMMKNFEGAANKISKFMANKKSTQLKLK